MGDVGEMLMSDEIVINTGFVYHIKDSYFEIAGDEMLMRNYEGGAFRPTCLCVKDDRNEIFWAIPMSSRVEKYKPIIANDIAKYGNCVKILVARFGERESAFLFQNMFPITAKYIDHVHTIGGNPAALDLSVRQNVMQTLKECLRLHRRGAKVIFTDIDRLEKLMFQGL